MNLDRFCEQAPALGVMVPRTARCWPAVNGMMAAIMAPDKEAVVTIQAECRRGAERFRLIDEEIMPQL